MHEHEIERRINGLEREIHALFDAVRRIAELLEIFAARLTCYSFRPIAGRLDVIFTVTGDSMNAELVATIPTTRQDGSALAPTDIASITFQKTSVTGTPAATGPEQTLITNTATAGAGLTPDQITYTDTTSAEGDSYTFFVTDTAGNVGAVSNAVVNTSAGTGTGGGGTTPPVVSPPAAGTLAATFS